MGGVVPVGGRRGQGDLGQRVGRGTGNTTLGGESCRVLLGGRPFSCNAGGRRRKTPCAGASHPRVLPAQLAVSPQTPFTAVPQPRGLSEEAMLELLLASCLTTFLPADAGALPPAIAPGPGAAAPQEKAKVKDLFPAPRTGLTLHVGDAGEAMTMLDLCAAYAQVTQQRLTFDEDTGSLLRSRRVQLDRSLDVEPEELQQVFETVMMASAFAVIPVLSEPTPVFRVESLQGPGRSNLRASAIPIAPEDAAILEKHPAVLFTTTLHLPNLDVRQLSNTMRTMITDANTQQLLPAGNSNSLVMVGFGSQLAGLRSTLLTINAAAGANIEDRRSVVEVFKLEHADAEDLAKILMAVFGPPLSTDPPRTGSTLCLADERSNSIVARATKAELARIKNLIAQLDIEVKDRK